MMWSEIVGFGPAFVRDIVTRVPVQALSKCKVNLRSEYIIQSISPQLTAYTVSHIKIRTEYFFLMLFTVLYTKWFI